MLDPEFLATIFVVRGCVLTNDIIQKGRGFFMSESETLLVDSLYAEAIEVVHLRAA
jgi:hypothetical protein